MSKGPIKRSPEIMPLSREHHFSLLFSWKIAHGLEKGISTSRIIDYVIYFWENNFRSHLENEENILFRHFPKDELVIKALEEHKRIRILLLLLQDLNQPEKEKRLNLKELSDLIHDHTRMEERILFPQIERQLSGEALKEAGNLIHDLVNEPITDDYQDEFWTSPKA